jgi:hypothetical protein
MYGTSQKKALLLRGAFFFNLITLLEERGFIKCAVQR